MPRYGTWLPQGSSYCLSYTAVSQPCRMWIHKCLGKPEVWDLPSGRGRDFLQELHVLPVAESLMAVRCLRVTETICYCA